MNGDQERRLISAVTAKLEPYDVFPYMSPRHAFVFYDPFGVPVAKVDICFGCSLVWGGPSDTPDVAALAELVDDLGLPLGIDGIQARLSNPDNELAGDLIRRLVILYGKVVRLLPEEHVAVAPGEEDH